SVFKSAWKSDGAPPPGVPAPEPVQDNAVSVGEPQVSALAPVSMREIDPGTIEIPRAGPSQPLPCAAGESVVAPMPWDHVQDSTITIPAAQTTNPAIETPADTSAVPLHEAEPAGIAYSEPVVEQGLPLSMAAMPGVEPETSTSTFSFAQPSLAPNESEPDFSL